MSEKSPFQFLPMWECQSCGYVFNANENQLLKCPRCGGDRIPPRAGTIENAVLRHFCKLVGIDYDTLGLKSHKERSEYAHDILATKLNKEQRSVLFQFFTIILEDGQVGSDMEVYGDFRAWTGSIANGGSTSVTTSYSHHGDNCMDVAMSGTGAKNYAMRYKNFTAITTPCCRIYFMLDSLPPDGKSTGEFIYFQGGPGAYPYIKNSGGTYYLGLIRMKDGGSGYPGGYEAVNTEMSFSTMTWYCLEVDVVIDGSDGSETVFFDGEEVSALCRTGADNDGGGAASTRIYVGANGYEPYDLGQGGVNWGSAFHIFIDCVLMTDTGPIGTEGATHTKTWATDVLFKKLGIIETVGLDAAFQKLDIPKTFGVDSTFQKPDIPKTFGLDAAFKKTDIQLSKQLDVLLKKLDSLKTMGIDADFLKSDVLKSFGLDVILGEAFTTYLIQKQVDVLLKKTNALTVFGVNVDFLKRDIGIQIGLDAAFRKTGIILAVGIDAAFLYPDLTVTFGLDVVLGEVWKGVAYSELGIKERPIETGIEERRIDTNLKERKIIMGMVEE